MPKILVCHTGAWIGDTVLLTPALRVLKNVYPNSFLTVLLRSLVAELMKSNPYVDNCIIDSKQKGRYKSFLNLLQIIRGARFDIAVVFHPTSIRNVLLPFFARIPIRVGTNYNGRGIFLTSSCPNNTNQHEIDRYLGVVNLLNQDVPLSSNNSETYTDDSSNLMEFWHTNTEQESINNLLQSHGVTPEHSLIGVNIGTTWQTKQWDVGNFTEVIHKISSITTDVRFILLGSTAENSLLIGETLPKSVINLVGKTNILELGAILELCKVCITCDSGPMHIAAAVGTPTVALFGPTDPKRHKPWGNGHTVIEKPVSCRPCYRRICHRQDTSYLCMKEIKSTEVVEAVITKLNL